MTYTTQQPQAMSDDELNQDLTALIAGEDWYKHGELSDCCSFFTIHNAIGEPYFLDVIDYCNNPNDIMPLAFERGISIIKDHDAEQYYACNAFDDRNYDFAYRQHEYFDDNPLRAIACLLLLMGE